MLFCVDMSQLGPRGFGNAFTLSDASVTSKSLPRSAEKTLPFPA
jgi:hypothetical protein